MRWEDERYVRLYTRDTVTWKLLPWQGKALLPLVLRKLDRAGMVDIDAVDPVDAVCALTDLPQEVVAPGLAALMKAGILQVSPAALVMPKFIEAQEAVQSDRVRKAESRARAREQAQSVTKRDTSSRNVTERHAESRAVTPSHTASQTVTPSRAVPCRAVPSRAEPGEEAAPPLAPLNSVTASLCDRMQAGFAKAKGAPYAWTRRDDDACYQLMRLSSGDDDEVVRRWEIALAWVGFPSCASLRDLCERWNAYAQPQARAGPVRDIRRGVARAEDQDHSKARVTADGTIDF